MAGEPWNTHKIGQKEPNRYSPTAGDLRRNALRVIGFRASCTELLAAAGGWSRSTRWIANCITALWALAQCMVKMGTELLGGGWEG